MVDWKALGKTWRRWRTLIILALPPIVFSPLPLASGSSESKAAYAILIMAVYWVTEVTHLAVTSLLPLLLFPILGVAKAKDISLPYFKDTTVLVLGGLMVAVAIERWNVHKRIALRVLLLVGAQPRRLMLGFMLMTAFISMWITNTATTAMMTPIMDAVLQQLDREAERKASVLEARDKENEAVVSYSNNQVVIENGGPADPKEQAEKTAAVEHDDPEDDLGMPKSSTMTELVKFGEENVEEAKSPETLHRERMAKAMLMSICYSANIGGTGTLTGTAPQLVLAGAVDKAFEKGPGVSFLSWFVFAFPEMLLLLIISWIYLQVMFFGISWKHLCFCFRGSKRNTEKGKEVYVIIKRQYEELGRMTFAEKAVLGHFVLLVLLWLFREPKFMPGWAAAFKNEYITDSTAVVLITFSLFLFPSEMPSIFSRRRDPGRKQETLLEWKYAQNKFPWNIILLLGSGFALADACAESGLSAYLGCQLTGLKAVPDAVVVLVICILITFLTEFTSNTATANILMPVLASLAQSIQVHPFYLMVPATVCSSFAFMLPVATPPNAIVFATGRLQIKDMALCGLGMNVIGIVVVTLAINTWGRAYYGLGTFPAWAQFLNGTNECEKVAARVVNSTMGNLTNPSGVNKSYAFFF